MNGNTINAIKRARRVSAPLLAVATPDQQATARAITDVMTEEVPVISWDICTGLAGVNQRGQAAVRSLCADDGMPPNTMTNLPEVLTMCQRLEPESVLMICNAHRYLELAPIESAAVVQAISNLRDTWKSDGRTLVLLGPGFSFPPEIEQDVLLETVPYPTPNDLECVITETFEGVDGVDAPRGADLTRAAERLRGLAPFSAEQAVALSVTRYGIDERELQARAVQVINSTPGLQVVDDACAFDGIGGVEQAKTFFSRLLNGRKKFNAVVWIDEAEKAFAGSSGGGQDSSGVSQGMLGAMLTEMQEAKSEGALFVGHPGCSKSMLAKALGAEANVPTVCFDMGAMKNSLVGESEKRLRTALRVIRAFAGSQVLWVATCNDSRTLPMALRRRLASTGTWFFDLPTPEERSKIWQVYMERFDLTDAREDNGLPSDVDCEGWTGFEIHKCAELAWTLDVSLGVAAEYIVPVCKADKEGVQTLRDLANGRFLSASTPGAYRSTPDTPRAVARRKVATGGQ